jgi:hypothetical protein
MTKIGQDVEPKALRTRNILSPPVIGRRHQRMGRVYLMPWGKWPYLTKQAGERAIPRSRCDVPASVMGPRTRLLPRPLTAVASGDRWHDDFAPVSLPRFPRDT